MTVSLGEISACYTVRFERKTKHSPSRLWEAITSAEATSRWMGYPVRIDLRVGGEWSADFSRTGGDSLECVIVRIEPERRFAYVWGLSVIEWTLEARSDGCSYSFVQSGLVDRGDGEEGLAAGWHEFLACLERDLEGTAITEDEEQANWERAKPAYREMLDRALPGRRG